MTSEYTISNRYGTHQETYELQDEFAAFNSFQEFNDEIISFINILKTKDLVSLIKLLNDNLIPIFLI